MSEIATQHSTATSALSFLRLKECETPEEQRLFGEIVDQHHSYVKHVRTPTRRIHWLIYNGQEPIGAIGINSCVMNLKPRDNLLGFTTNRQRLRRLDNLANNYRFCLIREKCPPNTASQVLKLMREAAPRAWMRKYGHKLSGIETFVGNGLRGSCYLADNWRYLGETQGWQIQRVPLKLMKSEFHKTWLKKRGGKQMVAKRTDPKRIFFTGLGKYRSRYMQMQFAPVPSAISKDQS